MTIRERIIIFLQEHPVGVDDDQLAVLFVGICAAKPWFWEGTVQAMVARYLVSQSCMIKIYGV